MTYLTKNAFPTFEELERINKAFSPFSIGLFDNLLDKRSKQLLDVPKPQTTYPPHSILKRGDIYNIVLAVAGFSKDAIEIEYFDKTLTIKGNQTNEVDEEIEIIYGGIANRAFTKTFTLADTIEVVGAELKDGILTITCKQWLPERLQKKTIPITQTEHRGNLEVTEPQLLNESKN